MKVLIITYYWPPAGGSGVQRWLKFVKYLQDFGITPIVYTVRDPNYAITDSSLLEEVPEGVEILTKEIWEPNDVLSKFKRKSTKASAGFLTANPTLFGKLLQYIRANFFIPDARKYWITPSVKYLKSYLLEHPVDAIITTGPPHSLHLIGLNLKKELGVRWISDFRDPWTAIDYFHQLPLTQKAKQKHFELEERVVKNSDVVLVVGKTMKKAYEKLNKNTYVLPNGFDTTKDDDLSFELDRQFSITHIGLMNADRNPHVLWEALNELCKENKEFRKDIRIKLVGKVADEVITSIQDYGFDFIEYIDYLPHHEVKKYQRQSQLLLLAINKVPSAKGIITGKIFEYLQAERPILAIGPEDGDLAEIIKSTETGVIVDFENKKTLKTALFEYYKAYQQKELVIDPKGIVQYHRKKITEELSKIIKKVIT